MTTAAILKWIISWHGLLVFAEIQEKLERRLRLPCNAARLQPPYVGAPEPDVRASGVWQRERAINQARRDARRPEEGKVAPHGLQELVSEFPHRSIPPHGMRPAKACVASRSWRLPMLRPKCRRLIAPSSLLRQFPTCRPAHLGCLAAVLQAAGFRNGAFALRTRMATAAACRRSRWSPPSCRSSGRWT